MIVIGHDEYGVILQNDRGKRFRIIESSEGAECCFQRGEDVDKAAEELIRQWESRYHKKWSPGLMEGGRDNASE